MIRVILPHHLQILASAPREVQLDVSPPVTQRTLLDARIPLSEPDRHSSRPRHSKAQAAGAVLCV